MERLPKDLSHKIFGLLDRPALAAAVLVCRKWEELADGVLWYNRFVQDYGTDVALLCAPGPEDSTSWKDVYLDYELHNSPGWYLGITGEGDESEIEYM